MLINSESKPYTSRGSKDHLFIGDLNYGKNILDSPPPWVDNRYRLISLWVIMERFDGARFIELNNFLMLVELRPDIDLSLEHQEHFAMLLSELEPKCERLGLRLSASTMRRIQNLLSETTRPEPRLQDLARELRGRLYEEMSLTAFFSLDLLEAAYYEQPKRGWDDVITKFPSVMQYFDIEEASKCLALCRYNASVFHAMRLLEIGLNVLATALGVSVDRGNWHNIIDQIESEIVAQSKALGGRWPDQQFYSESALHFRLLKDAWRNHIMHVRQTFDEERARQILDHVRAFMCHLAMRLSEPPRV